MTALTSLANVKRYLAITTTGQDALIPQLIVRESDFVERWTARRFPSVTVVGKRLDGTGTARLTLPEQPILSIQSLSVCGLSVAASSDGIQAGYLFDETGIVLTAGQRFPRVPKSVVCSWTAGYRASEQGTIPVATGNAATSSITPTTGGYAAADVGVTRVSNGSALTEVSGTPTAGQYAFDDGVYTFAAADANLAVEMTYDYVPGPVEQAVIEMVGLDLKQRDNLGIVQKQMAGEFIAYTDKNMTSSVQQMLAPFRRLAPC